MRNIFILLALVIILSACNYRILSNGHYDHKENGLSTRWQSTNDSCFVFESVGDIPDSVILVNNTKMLSPFAWMTLHSPGYMMRSRAKDEAKRIGANMILVTDEGATKFTRYRLVTKMYYLPEPYITTYRKRTDSLNLAAKKVNENFCIVHMKSYCYSFQYTEIYFNDSLVGTCQGATKKKGGFDIHRLDFKFNTSGYLAHPAKFSKYREGIWVEKGNEYYIAIVPTKNGDVFRSVKEHNF